MILLKRALVLCLFPGFLCSQNVVDTCATVVFAGDLNFAHNFEYAMQTHPFNTFALWNRVGQYDLMMVNLENAVTESIDSVKKEFVFKMKSDYLPSLRRVGIEVVNCANNHTADFGEEGILETIQQLDSAGILHTGIGRNLKEARKPVIINRHGVRIGFLGYGGVRDYIASNSMAGTTSRSPWLIIDDVKRLKSRVDFVVINLHWGDELETEPDSSQIVFAHKMIDSGADLIIGHHPHVLQGIEKYRGKIIAYSLGNFIFGGNSRSANCETAVLKARFSKEAMELQAVPVVVRNWRPTLADTSAGRRILNRLRERSKIFAETISLISLGVRYE